MSLSRPFLTGAVASPGSEQLQAFCGLWPPGIAIGRQRGPLRSEWNLVSGGSRAGSRQTSIAGFVIFGAEQPCTRLWQLNGTSVEVATVLVLPDLPSGRFLALFCRGYGMAFLWRLGLWLLVVGAGFASPFLVSYCRSRSQLRDAGLCPRL
jgi:hypothetical protein